MPQEITYYCSFCEMKETVQAPTTFATHHGGDVENAACRDHAPAMAFLDDQCPGCVSGWGECQMFMAIGNEAVSADDLAEIRRGRCPYRVNGTISCGPEGVQRLDISTTSKAGEFFARAIESS